MNGQKRKKGDTDLVGGMEVMDNSCIEIGNVNTQVSAKTIRKLKSILDQHCIFHIIDGVSFYHPQVELAQLKDIHQIRNGEFDATAEGIRKRDIYHSDCSKNQKLIVPELYELDYMSLIFFDSEEADFLAMLIYGDN